MRPGGVDGGGNAFGNQRLIWINAAEGLISRLRVSLPNGRAQGRSGADRESLGSITNVRLFHLGLAWLALADVSTLHD